MDERVEGVERGVPDWAVEVAGIAARVDQLAADDPIVRQEALSRLCTRPGMTLAAWKLAYELRDRLLYDDELVMPQCETIAAFDATPRLGRERARRAVSFVRCSPLERDLRRHFEDRFAYFSRGERTVTRLEAELRARDKTVCSACGKKMRATRDGAFMRLVCAQCDLTRFERLEDLRRAAVSGEGAQ